ADTPTGRIVASDVERSLGCRGQFGVLDSVNRQARIDRIKVGNVTMVHLRYFHVPVLEPLLELSGLADTVGEEPCSGSLHPVQKRGIGFDARSEDGVKQIATQLVVHCGADREADAEGMYVLR